MTPQDDSVPRDAWLKEALRHAPDADTAPSPRLDAAVLRMGRAAVAPRAPRAAPSPPTWLDHLGAAWHWLARPPVAAGFASVMVATVVGLMWWDRPIEEALPPRESKAVAAAATPQPEESVAESAPPMPAQAPSVDARVAAATRSSAATPAPAPTVTAQAPLAKSPGPAVAGAAAPERRREADAAKASDNAGTGAPVVAAAPPAPAAEPSARLGGLLERRALAAASKAEDARRDTETATAARAAAPLADAAPRAAAAAPAMPASSEFLATPGLSNLRFEIRAKPQGWTWQRDGGEARPVDEAIQGWIAQADRTARPRWLAGGADGDAATTLRFLRDGQVRAVLRIRAGGLRIDRGGKIESAELSGGQVAALRSALDAMGP